MKVEWWEQEAADGFCGAIFPTIGYQSSVVPPVVPGQPRDNFDQSESESGDSSNFGSDEDSDVEITIPQLKF